MNVKTYKIKYLKKGKKGYSKFTEKGQYKRVVTLGNKVVSRDDKFHYFPSEANLTRAIRKFDLPRQRFRDKSGRFSTAKNAYKVEVIEKGKKVFSGKARDDFFFNYVLGEEAHIFIGGEPEQKGEPSTITHIMGKYMAEFSDKKFPHTQIIRLFSPETEAEFLENIELYRMTMQETVYNYRDKASYKGDAKEGGKILNFQQIIGFEYLGERKNK